MSERLWAPWRLEYIKAPKKEGCPFCELPKEAPSSANLVLYSDADIFVVLNKFPYNPGHTLVLPRAHVKSIRDLDLNSFKRLNLALKETSQILSDVLQPSGMNFGLNEGSAAGAGIPDHMHWHIVPRWAGDTNFMPVIAETKAIPSHNATMHSQLLTHFKNFSERIAI